MGFPAVALVGELEVTVTVYAKGVPVTLTKKVKDAVTGLFWQPLQVEGATPAIGGAVVSVIDGVFV
jgi:hypothetical protein